MKNEQVAHLLNNIADLLELKNENQFKIRAYHEAARRIESLPEDIAAAAREDRLKEIHGVGESIAEKVQEYLQTGKSSYFDELAKSVAPGMAEIMGIPGVGAKKAQLFFRELGISTLDQLEDAAKSHRLCNLPGVHEKTEENVLLGIHRVRQASSRLLLGTALPAAEEVVGLLRSHEQILKVEVCGSIRRMKETIGDIDILASSNEPDAAIDAFAALPVVRLVLARGPTKASILTHSDLQMDLRVVPPESYGAALQYFTGSKDHNIQVRALAEHQGLKVNEYGVFRVKTKERVAGEDEEGVYRAIGLEWIPPELRERAGEIEAAASGRLPKLVELEDIKGDLHAHTKWSDGSDSLEDMAQAARERGYEYLVISDHSVSMGFIKGLTVERIEEQRRRIRLLNAKTSGFRILTGIEVNIRSDGTLDYDDEVVSRFDLVTASIHSGFAQSREKLTQRMIAAAENPHVDVIGHPTGRLIGKREPYDVDLEAVMKVAARTGVALEINSQPDRLDLRDSDARLAKRLGVTVAIDSDSHTTGQFAFMRYGVATARRGWIEKKDVLNALSLQELQKRPRKRGALAKAA
ncbi:MAG: DNA polymerase/3'-5' exonuclease PolX [Armatimonadota bacterium]|nr:DNA polymerase/3'-5' exonuclease PolX [Armatimonadota bacterium]